MSAETPPVEPALPAGWRWLFGAACAGLAAVLGWAALAPPAGPSPGGLTGPALAELPRSGVTNPVTAVLLNYRAYDTLLEVAVLLLAAAAVRTMARAPVPLPGVPRGPVPRGFARLATPLLLVLSGYFLWIGSKAPGGAFQGGALLGASGVLLLLVYGPRRRLPPPLLGRLALAVGLSVFLAVAAGGMVTGRRLLELPEASAGTWILIIESAAVVSIGATLVTMYLGGRAEPDEAGPGAGDRA